MKDTVAVIVVLDVMVIYLLLLGSVKFYGERCSLFRLLCAAIFSAIHSGAAAAGLGPCMEAYFVRIAVLCMTGMLAFGLKKGGLLKTAVFLLLNAAFEGLLNGYHGVTFYQQLAVAAVIALLCCFLRRGRRPEGDHADVTVMYSGRKINVKAMRDTGNDLRDILTGLPVLIVGPDAAFKLTGLTAEELAAPMETMERRRIRGLRLIPYSSIGNSHGLMLGIRIRDIRVDGIPVDMVIAMASEGMGQQEALIGGHHGIWYHQMGDRKKRVHKTFGPLHRRIGHPAIAAEGGGGKGSTGGTGTGR